MTTPRSHDLGLHISKIHKGSATKSVWAPKKCQTLDVQTQRWDWKEAPKIDMKVTRGMMRAGKKHFHLESFQSSCQFKELTSVKKQSVSQTVSEPAEPFSSNHMDEISVLLHSEAIRECARNEKFSPSLSLISYYRVADTSGLRSSIRPAEVPAWRWGRGAGHSQTGSCRLRKQSGGVLTVCGSRGAWTGEGPRIPCRFLNFRFRHLNIIGF